MLLANIKVKMVKFAGAPKGVSALVAVANIAGNYIDQHVSKELVKKYGSYCVLDSDLKTVHYAEKCPVHEDCVDYLQAPNGATTEIINAHFDLLKEIMTAALPNGFNVVGYNRVNSLLNTMKAMLRRQQANAAPENPADDVLYYNNQDNQVYVAANGVWHLVSEHFPCYVQETAHLNFPSTSDSNFGDTWYTVDFEGNFYTYMFNLNGVWKLIEVGASMSNFKFAMRDDYLPQL